MRWKKKRRVLPQKKVLFVRFCSAILVALLLFVALDREVRPVILTMAQYQARVSSILAMNQAVLEQMATEPENLQLTTIYRGEDGQISAIETDTVELNRLKAQLTTAVSEKLAQIQRTRISIPLGTLLGWQIFAGRGPDVNFQVVPASFVESDIHSSLTSAGINQTRQQIFIQFTVDMTAIIPGYSATVTVTTEVCIADTLIVGTVPQFYAMTGN